MANRLREWREAQVPSLSQADAAAKIGISQAAWDRYERDDDRCRRIPRPEIIVKICALTKGELTPNDFYAVPQKRGAAA